MTPVDQTILVGDRSGRLGDCWRACIATLLDLPTSSVPHFVELDAVGSRWEKLTDTWLRERGQRLVDGMICQRENGTRAFLEHGNGPMCLIEPDYLIVGGPTTRETRHVVIARGADYLRLWGERPHSEALCARWLAHDPHPSRAGLVAWDSQFAIVPLEVP